MIHPLAKRLLFQPLIWCISIISFASCQVANNWETPPDIHYGHERCDQCGMEIKDWRFAASYLNEQGELYQFDDIGDMLAFYQNDSSNAHKFWVHDMSSGAWIDAKEATLILNPDLKTPMHWGIAAFADKDDALSYIVLNGGQAATWQDMENAVGHVNNLCSDKNDPASVLTRLLDSNSSVAQEGIQVYP